MNSKDYRLKMYEKAAQTGKNTESKESTENKENEQMKNNVFFKVPVSSKTDEKDSIFRRVAKFLLIIGSDEAAKILPHLSQEQINKITLEIATIRGLSEDEARSILAEFESLVEKSRESGGVDTAFNILEKAFGPEKAQEIIEKKGLYAQTKPFEYLQEAHIEKIKQVLDDESDATRVLVLSQLPPKNAAAYINTLSKEEKISVVKRLANLGKIETRVLSHLDQAMREKMQKISIDKADSIDGKAALIEILKKMPSSGSLLSSIDLTDPVLGKEIKEKLFSMEDILKADDKFLQKKLQTMDDTSLAFLIAGKTQVFREKILNNISKGRKSLVLEEESLHKPMKKRDVDEVSFAFFTLLRSAWENGELILHNEDEIYVE